MLKKFILKAVVAPFASTVAAKVGEAVGDLLAYRINPPAPEDEHPVETEEDERPSD